MLTHRLYQSQEQTIHVVGGLNLAPVSAPDTLQLYVTDAWRVHTHINTLQHAMKSPYLTLGFSLPPLPLPFVLWAYVTRCGPTTNLIKKPRCNCVFACVRVIDFEDLLECVKNAAHAVCTYETIWLFVQVCARMSGVCFTCMY